jgi:SAM-dependent methyltransferase
MKRGISRIGATAIICLFGTAALSCARTAVPVPAPGTPSSREPDVVFVPTPYRVVDRMLEVARVRRDDLLFDLGSGDGRIVIAAARRYGARGVGIDIDSSLVAASRRNADTARVSDLVEFREADLFATNLRSASVVTLYLLTDLNIRLRPKLFAELRPGSRVVSHSFGMGDWEADSTLVVDNRIVYYWIIPANIAGRWKLAASLAPGSRDFTLQLEQHYQRITSAALLPSDLSLTDVRVEGDRVSFALRESGPAGISYYFDGRVDGDTMNGTITDSRSRRSAWSATRDR